MADERQEYVDRMYRDRGYVLDFHSILAAEDYDFLQGYNALINSGYTKPRTLDAKTKELLYIAALTAVGGSEDHIRVHVELALKYGATKAETLETLELTLAPAGVPRFMVGFQAWAQAVSPDRVKPNTDD